MWSRPINYTHTPHQHRLTLHFHRHHLHTTNHSFFPTNSTIENPNSIMASPSSSSPPSPPTTAATTTTALLVLPPPTSTSTPLDHPFSPTNSNTSSSPKLPLSSSAASAAKKTPPLPWTHQETLNLIQSYQDKWYSLKRGQLKASQWEQVSISVASRCGFDQPTKTSTQCRHKMEKLRKRYRAERVKPYPNSWQYFQLMDNMERGPFPLMAVKLHQPQLPNSTNFNHNNHSDSDDYDSSQGLDVRKNKSKSINNIVRGGVGLLNQNVNGSAGAGVGAGSSAYARNSGRISVVGGSDRGMMMPKVVREASMMNRKRMGYYDDSDDGEDDEEDQEVDVDGEGDDDGGVGDGGKELAAEIRGFAERFMRVEKMKIEMMRETERHRMEMEKRRMEMIIDSQRKIVDSIGRAFRAHKRLNTGQEL